MPESSTRPSLNEILRFTLRRIWLPAWLLPWLLMLLLTPAKVEGLIELSKSLAEKEAIIILGAALTIGVYRLCRQPRPWLIWFNLLVFSFLCREIHFIGTEKGIYVASLVLFGFAWLRYNLLADFLGSRLVITLLSTTMWCYLVAVGLDFHWWKFLPGDKYKDWQTVEEYIEVAGHLLLLAISVISTPTQDPLRPLNK